MCTTWWIEQDKKNSNKKISLIYWVFISNYIASFYTKAPQNEMCFYVISFVLLAALITLKTTSGALIIVWYKSATEFSTAGSQILQLEGQM